MRCHRPGFRLHVFAAGRQRFQGQLCKCLRILRGDAQSSSRHGRDCAKGGRESGMMEKSTQLPETWTPPAPPKYVPPALTAVRAGRLFDARVGKMLENQIILIEGERIIDVAPDVPIPAGATIIDLSHETVLPGLIDTHVHVM